MELGLITAAKKYKVSKQTLVDAIKKGKIPAMVVHTSELRVKPKDVAAYVATIPEWRQRNGRKGGLARMANRRARNGTAPQAAG
jgi:predicted site-specific integrase-resolvase